jgi:transcriptional regulator with XRE-family HTH domain
MEDLDKRLIKFIDSLNLNHSQFSDKIGVQRSSISHILSGRNKPSYDFLQKIFIAYPDLNADWLILGRGSVNNVDATVEKEKISDQIKNNTIKGPEHAREVRKYEISQEMSEKHDIKSAHIKLAKKVVIFYDDGTFREYNPEK